MALSAGSGSGTRLESDINVTPMVDVMLVLLIIFMVITPLLQHGVSVTLPRGKNPVEDGNIIKDWAVVVSIPEPGFYYVGRDLIPGTDTAKLIETIKKRMDAIKPSDPHIVYIKGGLNVPYGEVVKVINAIREAGFDQLGLVSEKQKPGEQ